MASTKSSTPRCAARFPPPSIALPIEYPRARIVVTSRIIGYQHQAWRDESFRHFMLQELDEAQIADFLARWHRGAYEDPREGEAKRELLARAIEDSAAIRQLAGNPLLLTMMAILNRTQDLPRDRAELYEQCARLLLHQWKVDVAFSSYPELAKASLDFKDKRGLLLRVARAMQTSERGLAGNLIDEATLETTLAEGLKGMPEPASRPRCTRAHRATARAATSCSAPWADVPMPSSTAPSSNTSAPWRFANASRPTRHSPSSS